MKKGTWRVAIAVFALVVSFAPAVHAGMQDVVSSESDELFTVPEYSSTMKSSASFRGTGIGGVKMVVSEAAEAMPQLVPYTGESIIGTDNRFRIGTTTTYPYRANTLITWLVGSSMYSCTGWFIGPNTVATAGHCVNKGDGLGWYTRSTYKIYPGRNGSSAPYGYCTAKSLHSVTGWTVNGYDDYDYGAIKLNCTKGNTTGWYGFYWTSATSMTGLPTTITGYPGDKPFGTMWRSNDMIRVTQPRRLFYANDTYGGQSGSAVYRYATFGTAYGPYSMAVHAYGTGGSYPYSSYNHGTRINQPVFNNLVYWKGLP